MDTSMIAKYHLGQEVFYMYENKVKSGIVGFIDMKVALKSGRAFDIPDFTIKISYGLLTGYLVPESASFNESRLFAPKEELLKTL